MGYYSNISITVTKKDYLNILKKDEKNNNKCSYYLSKKDGYVSEYMLEGVECVSLRQFSCKYYEEFEEVQLLEKYLSKTKDGYVFFRNGGRVDDFEYRNTAKVKELEYPFSFISQIQNDYKEKMLNEKKHMQAKEEIMEDIDYEEFIGEELE